MVKLSHFKCVKYNIKFEGLNENFTTRPQFCNTNLFVDLRSKYLRLAHFRPNRSMKICHVLEM